MPGPRLNAESVTFVPYTVFESSKMTKNAAQMEKHPQWS